MSAANDETLTRWDITIIFCSVAGLTLLMVGNPVIEGWLPMKEAFLLFTPILTVILGLPLIMLHRLLLHINTRLRLKKSSVCIIAFVGAILWMCSWWRIVESYGFAYWCPMLTLTIWHVVVGGGVVLGVASVEGARRLFGQQPITGVRKRYFAHVLAVVASLGAGGFLAVPVFRRGLSVADGVVMGVLIAALVFVLLHLAHHLIRIAWARMRADGAQQPPARMVLGSLKYLVGVGVFSLLAAAILCAVGRWWYGLGVEWTCLSTLKLCLTVIVPIALLPVCWDALRGLRFLARKLRARLRGRAGAPDRRASAQDDGAGTSGRQGFWRSLVPL